MIQGIKESLDLKMLSFFESTKKLKMWVNLRLSVIILWLQTLFSSHSRIIIFNDATESLKSLHIITRFVWWTIMQRLRCSRITIWCCEVDRHNESQFQSMNSDIIILSIQISAQYSLKMKNSIITTHLRLQIQFMKRISFNLLLSFIPLGVDAFDNSLVLGTL